MPEGKPEGKICPFKLAGYCSQPEPLHYNPICTKEECGVWDIENQQCGFLTAAQSINTLALLKLEETREKDCEDGYIVVTDKGKARIDELLKVKRQRKA